MSISLILILVAAVALVVAGSLLVRREIERARRRAELERQRAAARELVESGRGAVKAVLQTAARVRDQGLGGMLRSSIEELAGWAEVEQPDLRRMAARDGTVTILFSDIEDSTALNEQLGDRAWMRTLAAHDALVHRRVDAHGGHIVKSQGDGFMIAFASPQESLRCAIEIQRAFAAGNRRLRKTPIRVRIGIHVGQAVAKEGDLFGRNVAFAARVAGQAEGGEILVSQDVSEATGDGDGIRFTSPREVELKGLPGRHRLLAVDWETD
jgi:adenylate cyclase